MKKSLISLFVGAASMVSAFAGNTVTLAVQPGTFTNLLTGFPGSVYVQQITAQAPGTNVSFQLIDTPTNSLGFTNASYTYITRYATNLPVLWTNYYGVAQGFTNIALFTITNTQAATTSFYPIRFSSSVASNSTVQFGNQSSAGYYFDNGVFATNTSSGIVTLTIQYR